MSAAGRTVSGQAAEVSQGGIAILTVAHHLTVGEVFRLQFKLRRNVLRLRAIIRNKKGDRYGMEFLFGPHQREHICSSTLVDRTLVTSRLCHGELTVSSLGHNAEPVRLFVPAC